MDNQTLYKALDSILDTFTKEANWLTTKVYHSDLRDELPDGTKDILTVALAKLIEDGYITKDTEEEPYTLADFALERSRSYITVYKLTIKGVEFINSGGYLGLDLEKSLSLNTNTVIAQPNSIQQRLLGILTHIWKSGIIQTLIATFICWLIYKILTMHYVSIFGIPLGD